MAYESYELSNRTLICPSAWSVAPVRSLIGGSSNYFGHVKSGIAWGALRWTNAFELTSVDVDRQHHAVDYVLRVGTRPSIRWPRLANAHWGATTPLAGVQR